ncbi:MAG: TrbG/VirB9 family P-type conjugative transfer protein [Pseudomonadota bacterium]|nr:TrbG/VirB9 family P-type conjugative transfer protein [Pseudomonadota bacterium]
MRLPRLAHLAPALMLAFALASPLHAEITPRAGEGDPHIQTVAYDPQQVVALHVAAGYALTVEISPDERIETVTLGDTTGWNVTVSHRADHLVVKPQGSPPPTNLTVISDQRSYNFTLYSAFPGEGLTPYLVSFTYPASPTEPVLAMAAATYTAAYRLRGDKAIWPTSVSDDGLSTAIRWPVNRTIPAVYQEDESRHLALVNGVMQSGRYVIEGVHSRLVFVLGRARASADRTDRSRP